MRKKPPEWKQQPPVPREQLQPAWSGREISAVRGETPRPEGQTIFLMAIGKARCPTETITLSTNKAASLRKTVHQALIWNPENKRKLYTSHGKMLVDLPVPGCRQPLPSCKGPLLNTRSHPSETETHLYDCESPDTSPLYSERQHLSYPGCTAWGNQQNSTCFIVG